MCLIANSWEWYTFWRIASIQSAQSGRKISWQMEGLGLESVLCYKPAFIPSTFYIIVSNHISYLENWLSLVVVVVVILLTQKGHSWPQLIREYLEQRRYRSGEICWMTFPWPWLKVTFMALINKNLQLQHMQTFVVINDYTESNSSNTHFRYVCTSGIMAFWHVADKRLLLDGDK